MKMYEVYETALPESSHYSEYFHTVEEAESSIASRWKQDSDGRHPGSEYLSIRIVERTSKPCVLCGSEVTSGDPDKYPYCRSCHYSGSAAKAINAEGLRFFEAAFPEATVSVDHTGGGCMWLAFYFEGEDRFYVATDGDACLPDHGKWLSAGEWGYVGRHAVDPDDDEEFEEDENGFSDYYGTPLRWEENDQFSAQDVVDTIRADRAARGLS